MIDSLYGGMASAAYPMGYTFMGLSDPLAPEDLDEWHQYNPDRAKQLLADAGYANGFEMEYIVSGNPDNADVLTQQYLEGIGVRLTIQSVESTVVTATRLNKRFRHAIKGESSSGFTPIMNALDLFLPSSPRNYAQIDDPVMTDLVNKATYTLDPDEQTRLVRQINDRATDQCYALERVVSFHIFFRQPWLHNVASAVQGWYCCFGSQQVGVAWIDDTAPAGRAGRLKT
jgi:peptide/nickel transport system substrate-binding protein